ncbi:MAG: hypothetical protein KAT93_06065 [Desulfuromonadales bacterium]|nr:hypothetical protein [Desulfuromonadales bacterium]
MNRIKCLHFILSSGPPVTLQRIPATSEIVIVIDASKQNFQLLERILNKKGYWVLTAGGAEEALGSWRMSGCILTGSPT